MRTSRLLAISALALWGFSAPVVANESTQVPWDEIDRILKEEPATDSETSTAAAAENSDNTKDDAPVAKPAEASPPVTAAQAPPEFVLDGPEPQQNPASPAVSDDPNALPPADAAAPATPPAAMAPAPAEQAATPPPTTPAIVAHGDLLYLPFTLYIETRATEALAGYAPADRDAMVQFYGQRMGAALWVSKNGFNDDGKALIEELGKADDWGLRAKDYIVPSLIGSDVSTFSEDDLTDAEARLTLAALAYARHARGDRITDPTTQLSSYLDRKPNLVDRKAFLDALATAADKSAYLRSVNPKHPQFERLRQKLLALRNGEAGETYEKIPSGKNIAPGKSHPHIALIRARLKVPSPGMKPDGTAADDTYYDQTLASAVIRFKEKNDLSPANATITKDLRGALNSDSRVSEATLLANMEQWRWMPDDLGTVHVEVNIPEFMVRVYKDNVVVHAERIVSGKRDQQTPVFSDRMSTIVFQPRWIVPNSIKVNELLPGLRYGGNPIARQGLVVERNGRRLDPYEVDWYRSDIRNYDIYQPPGPSNVLGVVKFLFPNKHAVYLHDTGSKGLFNEKVRTFSHGCMRVRNPVRLAEIILEQDKGWDAGTVNDVLNDGPQDNDIKLDKPIPVHVTYFTATVDDNGELKTFGDVYGHEKRIKLGLEGRWNEIEKNRDHLLPAVPSAVSYRDRYDEDWYAYDAGGRRGYGAQGYWSYNAPPPRPYAKKKYYKGGGFFDQLFGN